MQIGEIFTSKWYGPVEVIGKGKESGNFIIRFSNTGTEMEAFSKNIEKGNVKDRFAPSVAGVGYLGNASSTNNPALYSRWKRMLGACYDPLHVDYKNTGGKGITVDVKWHSYEAYERDILELVKMHDYPSKYRLYRNGDLFSLENIIMVKIG